MTTTQKKTPKRPPRPPRSPRPPKPPPRPKIDVSQLTAKEREYYDRGEDVRPGDHSFLKLLDYCVELSVIDEVEEVRELGRQEELAELRLSKLAEQVNASMEKELARRAEVRRVRLEREAVEKAGKAMKAVQPAARG